MSRFDFLRSALSLSLGLAAACVSLPVLADAPVNVTFAANSVWAQEVGNLDRSSDSLNYTVAIAAGKTLQLNLLSRNPNVQFKVTDQSQGKVMLDSRKTGETTWSTTNVADTTYAIQVYIDPAAIASGETAKYALQVGQYGAADLQAPTTAVTFEANQPWAVQNWTLASNAASHNFSVAIAAGMAVTVNLVSSNPQVQFKVDDQTHAKKLVDTATTGAKTWSESVADTTTYLIQVYVDPAALPSGQKAQFALQVGQYASGATQPAAAASAATAESPAR
ncbi:hypothetical protein PY254_12370 [Rhodanobacter sp. AS-Z3]|uniref:hypothetical protein n=1 Tax=Rhodanobacter sp. AS-Z3 TaxID=3031330 RepID=UPI00247879A2|nr:hypothetical protein [Rhodanobacter sp. AS-Z3]WEN14029.1 hypothetical protein PY254_12370 [Rhodanobacter sp. AS-Z3]